MRTLRQLILLAFVAVLTACETGGQPEPTWKIINFWAVWCAPCREEIPELNELARQFAGQVIVQGVNYDTPDDQVGSEQAASLGIEFDTISSNAASVYGIQKPSILPTTFILKNGEIHSELKGPQTYEALEQLMGLSVNSE